MADDTKNRDETANIGDGTKNPISRGTLVMLAATVVFIIVASILIASFFNSPAGTTNTNPAQADSSPSGSDTRAKP